MSEDQQQQEKKYAAPTSAKFATGALLSALPVLAHFGPTGLLLSGVAGFVAYRHGPEVYDLIRNDLSFLPSLEGRTKKEPRAPGERTMWARLIGAPALHDEQDEQAQEQRQDEQGDYWTYDRDDGDEPGLDSSMFTFSQLLASGFRPTLHKIFLGRLSDGTDVFVEAKDLCHVALAGNTGNGKSSLLRLIMVQLCYIRVNVVLLNPHYMVYEHASGEDWTPYTPYLARNPLDYVKPDQIAFMLKWIIEHTLARRIELGRVGKSVGKPYFVVIDELPAIVSERKECAGYIAKLLKEGRKYGIFLIVASTDFQVKTIGMDDTGGAVRKNFRTACYVGGDPTTARVLLEKQEKPIPETDLGKGKMMLRCAATGKAVLASVPYCDNEALYLLLGPSTFTAEKDIPDIHHSPASSLSELGAGPGEHSPVKTENAVNEPVKPVNASVNDGEYSPATENILMTFTPSEEVQVLLAYAEMLKSEKQITRTGIRDLLKWDNKQYQRIVKPVCDKHHIAEREG
jgi:hypothetical protein